MLKTYLYIPDQLEEKIINVAKVNKISKAEVMRQSLEKGIDTIRRQGNASAQILLRLADLGKRYKLRGPKDSSARMDELLWGKDWNQNG
ncbi:hypothetical protein HYU89_04310 [Candidatus Collierbacteria bacterium]|nr:hypothetical protein [Candidatus Collierbacteria bacterium]